MNKLEKKINYEFKNKQLLEEALTHTSYANEFNTQSNEKLEFLGDSILEFISSKYLYNNYPKLNEGKLTKARAESVCEESLYEVAKKFNISEYIRVGHSEKNNNGNHKLTILADSIEALIAAIFIDGGLKKAEAFILENFKTEFDNSTKAIGEKDYKTVLQEELQKNKNVVIKYRVISESGPDHDKSFMSMVEVNGKMIATGEGKSKKLSEMQAAKRALRILNNQ